MAPGCDAAGRTSRFQRVRFFDVTSPYLRKLLMRAGQEGNRVNHTQSPLPVNQLLSCRISAQMLLT